MADQTSPLPPKEVLEHIIDVHCHPTVRESVPDDVMNAAHIKICNMATHWDDQQRVSDLATKYPEKVVPGFGFHPWFYHLISLEDTPPPREEHYRKIFMSGNNAASKKEEEFTRLLQNLPEPRSLKEILANVRANLLHHPNAMLGEVGLDRTFRISYQSIFDPPPKKLSPFSTAIDHQIAIFEAQLELAVELKRNVSIHSVGCQHVTIDLLQRMKEKYGPKWRTISIDMHSCGLSLEGWKKLEENNPNIYLSLSMVINTRGDNHIRLIKNCAEHRLLTESDYHEFEECAPQTWNIVKTIADLKGWPVETTWDTEEIPKEQWGAVRRLEANWKRFVQGDHPELPARKSRRLRKQHENYPGDESEEE